MKRETEGGEERYCAGKLRDRGRDVSNDLKAPICWECLRDAAAKKEASHARIITPTPEQKEDQLTVKPSAPEQPKEGNVNVVPLQGSKPRDPTPADRRRILDQLDIDYDDKAIGYLNGLSDEKMAAKMGVPRAWVTKVREEYCGPDITVEQAALAPEYKLLIADRDALGARVQKLSDDFAIFRDRVSAFEAKAKAVK